MNRKDSDGGETEILLFDEKWRKVYDGDVTLAQYTIVLLFYPVPNTFYTEILF